MRHHQTHAVHLPNANAPLEKADWATLKRLLPYLWQYKARVMFALVCLVVAKAANVGVPLVLKYIIDALTPRLPNAAQQLGSEGLTAIVAVTVPLSLLLLYGLFRISATVFTELRELLFARVTQNAVRVLSIQVFNHLHGLSLRFHLNRQTGGLTRDIERGSRGVSSLVSYTLYSILPTLVEIMLVVGYLLWQHPPVFGWVTLLALMVYVLFTVVTTEWRTQFRRTMNELDSKANVRAVDSLLNFETVKYFNNEGFESERYNRSLQSWQEAAIRSQQSLTLLNSGQSAIIAVAATVVLWQATLGVVNGTMSLGDLVLINAFMIQLYVPLNFLGVIYREIKQNLADIERMFGLLTTERDVQDAPNAKPLVWAGGNIVFRNVGFAYDSRKPILRDINLSIQAGQTVAFVGHSGAGKSTLTRLLYRFYDVTKGAIEMDGQDVRHITQASLRAAIGIVPQDTVLFNDTIAYNIAYGRPGASQAEIQHAAQAAAIHDFIQTLPDGYATVVGERGLKLSGGEKQRVAIARTILKNPGVLIFDEATSALDSQSERLILNALDELSKQRTTLIIAHRLSTIVHADNIVVLQEGRIVEQGTHTALLERQGVYARMWAVQQSQGVRS